MLVLFECQFEVGLHLELAALIDFCAPGIVAAVVPTLFGTFAVIVIRYDSHRRRRWNRTEQHRK
jgi:hypothetical protein